MHAALDCTARRQRARNESNLSCRRRGVCGTTFLSHHTVSENDFWSPDNLDRMRKQTCTYQRMVEELIASALYKLDVHATVSYIQVQSIADRIQYVRYVRTGVPPTAAQ